MEQSLLSRIKNIIDKKDNKNIINFSISKVLLDNIDSITNISINDIAKQSNTSTASVTRFCQKNGCKGFKELIYDLNFEYNLSKNKPSEIKNDKKIINSYIKNYGKFIVKSIDEVMEVNLESLYKITEQIKKSKRIFLFGIGTNADLLSILSKELSALNKNIVYYNDYDFQIDSSKIIEKDDLAIVMSFSMIGQVIETILDNLITKNINTILMTHNKKQLELDNLSYVYIPINEGYIKDVHSKATFAFLFIILSIVNLLREDD